MSDKRPPTERIDSLDLIRGVGIIGILYMNVMGMAAPEIAYYVPTWYETATVWDHLVYLAQSLFVESRFMGMFSLLFGVGLAIQSERLADRGLPVKGALRRRQAWLLVFGLIHGFLIWSGDILTAYAVAGFLVLNWTRWPVRRLVAVGIAFLAIAQVVLLLAFAGSLFTGRNIMDVPELPYTALQIEQLRSEWTRSLARLRLNAGAFLEMLASVPFVIFWQNSGTMLIGMALYKSGFFTRPPARRRLFSLLGIGFAAGTAVVWLRYSVGVETSAAKSTLSMMMIPGLIMAIAYAGLLVPFAAGASPLIRALRNAGKTAFTLYMSQSVLVVGFFVLMAPSLWGALGRGPLWIIVAAFSVIQVLLADRWQTRHGQGPLERLWRKLAKPPRSPRKEADKNATS